MDNDLKAVEISVGTLVIAVVKDKQFNIFRPEVWSSSGVEWRMKSTGWVSLIVPSRTKEQEGQTKEKLDMLSTGCVTWYIQIWMIENFVNWFGVDDEIVEIDSDEVSWIADLELQKGAAEELVIVSGATE